MKTRPLTTQESNTFIRKLHIALGKETLVEATLRTIAESGLGLFITEDDDQ